MNSVLTGSPESTIGVNQGSHGIFSVVTQRTRSYEEVLFMPETTDEVTLHVGPTGNKVECQALRVPVGPGHPADLVQTASGIKVLRVKTSGGGVAHIALTRPGSVQKEKMRWFALSMLGRLNPCKGYHTVILPFNNYIFSQENFEGALENVGLTYDKLAPRKRAEAKVLEPQLKGSGVFEASNHDLVIALSSADGELEAFIAPTRETFSVKAVQKKVKSIKGMTMTFFQRRK